QKKKKSSNLGLPLIFRTASLNVRGMFETPWHVKNGASDRGGRNVVAAIHFFGLLGWFSARRQAMRRFGRTVSRKFKKGKQEMGGWKKARSRVDVAMDWRPKS